MLFVLLALLPMLLAVLVRLKTAFPVCGGEARLGETSDMLFKKSRYATGGVIGVFWRSFSNLSVALKGPADGKPADGRPEEKRGSRNADDLDTADNGVLSESAEGSDTADRASETEGGRCGKFAVTGVDSDRVGLTDMIAIGTSTIEAGGDRVTKE